MENTYEEYRRAYENGIGQMEKCLMEANCDITKEEMYILLKGKIDSILSTPVVLTNYLALYVYFCMQSQYVNGYIDSKGSEFKKLLPKEYHEGIASWTKALREHNPSLVPQAPPVGSEKKE